MKKTPKKSMAETISDFVSLNSFVLLILIGIIAFHQIIIVGGTVADLKDNQNKMITYLKENVSKVHYLTASGLVVTTSKSSVSLSDDRFKSYLANEITDTFIAGLIKLSDDYEIKFASPEEIVTKNKRINDFFNAYIKPKGSVIADSIRTLHRAILEKRYPEYIDATKHHYEKYIVRDASQDANYKKEIDATIIVNVVVKSWITELKKWHTIKKDIRIPFKAIVDVDNYAKMDNPFGVHFEKLDIPILRKSTATQVKNEQADD